MLHNLTGAGQAFCRGGQHILTVSAAELAGWPETKIWANSQSQGLHESNVHAVGLTICKSIVLHRLLCIDLWGYQCRGLARFTWAV